MFKQGKNSLADLTSSYTKHMGKGAPLYSALVIGAVPASMAYFGWKPLTKTVKSLGRMPAKKMGFTDQQWEMAMENAAENEKLRMRMSAGVAGLNTLLALAAMYQPTQEYGALLDANAPVKARTSDYDVVPYFGNMPKHASLYDSYIDNTNFGQPIGISSASSLFTPSAGLDSYHSNLGTSIINSADRSLGSNTTTLGGILDSAVNKISTKLNFEGVAKAGVRSLVANTAARMFTSALDTMVGLPQPVQQNLIDTGTWAGAITSILS